VIRPFLNTCSFVAVPCLFVLGMTLECFAQDKGNHSFEETVKPFLVKHCYDCHSGDEAEAEFDVKALTADFSADENANRWIDVMNALQFGDMPPPGETQPKSIKKANVVDWVFQKMAETNRFEAYQKKLLAPEYGNWVNHEKLFSGEIDTPPFSPARLWRFSPEIFASKGFGDAKSPYTYLTSERGIRDYAAMSMADQSTVQMKMIVADSFLAEREKRGEFADFAKDQPKLEEPNLQGVVRREFLRVIGREPTEAEQEKYLSFLKQNINIGGPLDGLKTTIKAMFLSPESIYRMEFGLGEVDEHGRRHLSPDELAYALAYALTNHGPDRNQYIREALEKGELKTKKDVARLVQQLVDEQLTTGHWHRKDLPRIRRFFDEFFGFHRAGTVFKDSERQRAEKIRQWNTEMLVYDASLLIEHVLKKDQDVIAELLTTNEYFIAHPGDNAYARERYEEKLAEVTDPGYIEAQVAKRREQIKRDFNFEAMPEKAEQALQATRNEATKTVANFTTALAKGIYSHPSFPYTQKSRGIGDLLYIEPYNLPSSGRIDEQTWAWPLEQPLEMPREQRAGLLTHPAWLTAHSLNEDNDPIHRGIWVYKRLLAGVLGDIPPDVDAVVPMDPHKTLRERMEPLRAERCWKCHRKINPLGEPFEVFDDWGRYRVQSYFDENKEIYLRRDGQFDRKLKEGMLTTRAIDASGEIRFSGDPEVDGEVKDAIEMMHRLGNSNRARQSFIRHLFRYFMGRNEMLSDSRTLLEAEQAYLNSGGSFKSLVVSLLSSDSFLYRR
jgi:hypothetical protein